MEHHIEHCRNPWSEHCDNEHIKLYIQFKGEIIPICDNCWDKIADQDKEW